MAMIGVTIIAYIPVIVMVIRGRVVMMDFIVDHPMLSNSGQCCNKMNGPFLVMVFGG